jgi:hypothetical protein
LNRNQLLSLVDRITARVQNHVWQRVRDRVSTMGLHEARGYIRARAVMVVEREMAVFMAAEPSLPATQWVLVERSVRHRVIRRMLLENLRRKDALSGRRRMAA